MGLIRGEEFELTFPLYSLVDEEFLTGASPTVSVSRDGVNFASSANATSEIESSGIYRILLSTYEMDAEVVTVRIEAATAYDQTVTLATDVATVATWVTSSDLDPIVVKIDDILARITALSTATISAQPLIVTEQIVVHAGDDYRAGHHRAIVIYVADAAHSFALDDPDVSFELRCTQGSWTAYDVESVPTGYMVTFELPRLSTRQLTLAMQDYKVIVTLADDSVITLQEGTLLTKQDVVYIPPEGNNAP